MNQPQTSAEDVRIAESSGDQNQYLTFQIGHEMFAVGILHIREIIEYGSLTTVPMMPEFVRGVINLRGSVVPVIDLSARFGRGESTVNRRSCIVILEVEGSTGDEDQLQEVGIIVDAVSEVLEIPPTEIEPAPGFGARIRADFIAGMGKVQGQFVILLNVDQALNTRELAELDSTVDAPRDGYDS
ncbi:purine-binding chemotaxis protein CheW [Natronospirillum operosum]|uniref:Purine-binding chemotaxis protein CheW n=1 Tax=Natronospirillum operosum TaxID=2759953 RepID=A0A4Z0WIX3_9GAMM|nr:chemotaxis protein CheW [Natronospirillum operosum]TGG95786.1 purine-binding chemotaxis protein CheW [Natronospirillum operosum]